MRVALISQKEIQLLARLLGTGNIEAYLSYKEFKKFQEEVGEDLAFLQSCHSKYTELQAFAVKDFEQELENPHLENTKILLCEVAEYVDLNRKLLNNKKENLDLLNQLYDILASHYKILDPNFNTADLFKVLENIWSFDIEAIKKIIELFEDFVIIDNCNLLLDKSNLEKILKYSNLI
ncbi:MAG: hypothetical protein LBC61_00690 [Candidatus Peribacteria bacterium]|jgi:hypothetical protein|nr:hypothetical protein [Candidatus Peribacteria bacterium]